MAKKILVTGTLRSGKTTLLRAFQTDPQISIVREAAQDLIDIHGYEITQDPSFQDMVFNEQLRRETVAEAHNYTIILCDRGTLDNIAFCRVIGVAIKPEWLSLLHNRYDAALILNKDDITFDTTEYEGRVAFDMTAYRNSVDAAIRQVVREINLPTVEVSGSHETRVKIVQEYLLTVSGLEGNSIAKEGTPKELYSRHKER